MRQRDQIYFLSSQIFTTESGIPVIKRHDSTMTDISYNITVNFGISKTVLVFLYKFTI